MGFKEEFSLPGVELTEKEIELVKKLKEFAAKDSGNKLVEKIIKSLEMGFPEAAKTLCINEADKFRSTPELIDILLEGLFAEDKYKPWGMFKKNKN